jgi:hypothetical protein
LIELRVLARVTGIQAEPRFYGESMLKTWRVDFETGPSGRDKAQIRIDSLDQARLIEIGKTYDLHLCLTPGAPLE